MQLKLAVVVAVVVLKHESKHAVVPVLFSRCAATRTCLRNSEIQCSSGLTSAYQLRKIKENTRFTYSSENSVSLRRQLCLTVPVC